MFVRRCCPIEKLKIFAKSSFVNVAELDQPDPPVNFSF